MKLNFNGVPNITPAQYDAIRRELRYDGWKSALSGVGTASFDKRESVVFEADIVTTQDAREMWRGDDLAKRIIETVPSESVREGFKFSAGEDDEGLEIAEKVMEKWKKLDAYGNIKMGRCFERAYGGGALLIGADDGQKDWSRPLNPKAIRKLEFLTWFEPDELMPLKWYSNWKKPKFGKPALFQLNPYSIGMAYEEDRDQDRLRGIEYIHESRLIQFGGMRIGRNPGMTLNGGWGDNVLTPTKRTLRDFNMSWSSAAVLVMEFATPIFKMKGLDQLIAMDRDDEFKRRIQAAQLARSVLRAMLIDAEEEFTREQTPISGLPDLLDRFSTRLAAAADMPVTLLMGQSPAGLNATGESDIRFFYDRTKGSQIIHEVPALETISRFCMQAMGIQPPKAWSIEPNPLWQPTEKEQAETRFLQAQTDEKYLMASVLTPQEVKKNRFTADGGSFTTFLDEDPNIIDAEYSEVPPDIRQVPGAPDPKALPAAGGTTGVPQFNGAQIQSAYNIIAGIGKKEIPKESARQMLVSFLGMSPEDASKMAIDFTAAPDPSAPPPPKPAAPPVGKPPAKGLPSSKAEKMDWDPDQPRAENGQWGEGGSSGSSSKSTSERLSSTRSQRVWAEQELASGYSDRDEDGDDENDGDRIAQEEMDRESKMTDTELEGELYRTERELRGNVGNKHAGALEAKRDHIRAQLDHRREKAKEARSGEVAPPGAPPGSRWLREEPSNQQADLDAAAYARSRELAKAQTPITGGKSYTVETPQQTAARMKGLRELKSQVEQRRHEAHAARAREQSDQARELAAAGKLREATAETRRATESFKAATRSATKQEGRNEGKARRARERREAKAKGISVAEHRASKK